MDNIILIGFMGSGKTTVGKELAKALSFHFYDTDQLLEKEAGQSVKEIFSNKGEAYFRNLETKLIKDLKGKINNTVLSVGGGLPIQPGNAKLLKELGTVIYLSTSKETIKKRLSGDVSRPLLAGTQGESRLVELYTYREPFYKSASHMIVTTDNKNIHEIITTIIEDWREV